jgi:ribosomal protein S18 acetylase RimI-like enzyme
MKRNIEAAVLENRLAFITHHRDKRESMKGIEIFHGEIPFFKNAYVFDAEAIRHVPADFEIHIPRHLGLDADFLRKKNWHYKMAMKYALLSKTDINWRSNPDIKVQEITDRSLLPAFSEILSKGFGNKSIEDDPFHPLISKSSERNFDQSHHRFYMAFLDDAPIAALLAFYHEGLVGLYSIATIEEYRGRGASTTLMKKAVEDAFRSGMDGITLQTMVGSYAEGFYEKLGFEEVLTCDMYEFKVEG